MFEDIIGKKKKDICINIFDGSDLRDMYFIDCTVEEIENLMKKFPFVKKYGDKAILVATKTEKANGIVTGKFVGKNCSKWEKVKRIIEIVDLSNAFISVYTDGFHDKPLISIGNEVHLVKK